MDLANLREAVQLVMDANRETASHRAFQPQRGDSQ
jgi:hypothetical protein